MKYIVLVLFIVTFLKAEHLVEYDYELDAYYSNVSAFIDLDRENNITDASDKSESDIYKNLVLHTLNPNVFLLEFAIHPMALGGLYFRNQNEELYDKSKVKGLNLVKALTSGYEEPYSVSFFVGRMMVFKRKNGEHIGKNRAYIGYLVTLGKYSIKDNLAYMDEWCEVEFKLKGTREKLEKDLDWSFRVGGRFHSNRDFTNTLYIGARRSSIDYKKSVWSFIYNSAFNVSLSVDAKTFRMSGAEFMVEKKWPLSWGKKTSFGLGLGYLYYGNNKYSGQLKEDGVENHQLLIRPNFKW